MACLATDSRCHLPDPAFGSLASDASQRFFPGFTRLDVPADLIITSTIVHHQQPMIINLPHEPIHPTFVPVQQAHLVTSRTSDHLPLDILRWFSPIGQCQIQTTLTQPHLGRTSHHLIQFPRTRTQSSGNRGQLKITPPDELRHLGINLPILHIHEELDPILHLQEPMCRKLQSL